MVRRYNRLLAVAHLLADAGAPDLERAFFELARRSGLAEDAAGAGKADGGGAGKGVSFPPLHGEGQPAAGRQGGEVGIRRRHPIRPTLPHPDRFAACASP